MLISANAFGADWPPKLFDTLAWPAILFPKKNVGAYWVGERMLFNGAPMRIQEFEFDRRNRESTAVFYQEWLETLDNFSATELPNRSIYSALKGGFAITVELIPPHSLSAPYRARISSMYLGDARGIGIANQVNDEIGLPMPTGTVRQSETISFDPGKINATTIFQNSLSVEVNSVEIRKLAVRSGWTVLSSVSFDADQKRQIVLRKNSVEAVVAISLVANKASVVTSITKTQ